MTLGVSQTISGSGSRATAQSPANLVQRTLDNPLALLPDPLSVAPPVSRCTLFSLFSAYKGLWQTPSPPPSSACSSSQQAGLCCRVQADVGWCLSTSFSTEYLRATVCQNHGRECMGKWGRTGHLPWQGTGAEVSLQTRREATGQEMLEGSWGEELRTTGKQESLPAFPTGCPSEAQS